MKSVIGMGNALTDILINLKNDEILDTFKLPRGSMNLVDSELQRQIDASVADAPHAFARRIGFEYDPRTGPDGRFDRATSAKSDATKRATFRTDAERTTNRPRPFSAATNRRDAAYRWSPPDGERTMCTYLGAALEMRRTELYARNFRRLRILLHRRLPGAGSRIDLERRTHRQRARTASRPRSGEFQHRRRKPRLPARPGRPTRRYPVCERAGSGRFHRRKKSPAGSARQDRP